MCSTRTDYFRENGRVTWAEWNSWRGGMTLAFWLIAIIAWFGYLKPTPTTTLQNVLTVAFVALLPLDVLVFTPRKMWLKAQKDIAALQRQLAKQIAVLFVP